jgi:RNA polymerase sigma-70 factor, ECF subfamily
VLHDLASHRRVQLRLFTNSTKAFQEPTMDEASLIAAARLGDEDAFAELYRQHASYVRAIGRAILHKSDLDDMCQDTFLLAFTRLRSFEGNCQFRTWISRIATNQCLLTLRKARQASNGESHLIQIDAELAAGLGRDRWIFASTDKGLEGLAARLDLNRLLSVLNPIQRRVLEMAYLEGTPGEEIAELLDIPLSSVKNKIHRAKTQLMKIHKKR